MIALDSARWAELRQAFGGAEDVPRLLEALEALPDEEQRSEVWFALWRMLCPPDAVFSASYAAVPHVLRLSEAFELRERTQSIQLVASIEVARHRPGAPSIPDDLLLGYARAIESLPGAVLACAIVPWDAEVAQVLAAALLVGKRQPALGARLLELGSDPAP
jgi:hypothetical protein